MSETSSDFDSIACPHGCGHVMKDLWDYDWPNCRDELITECGECLKPVTIYRIVSVSYRATADEIGVG